MIYVKNNTGIQDVFIPRDEAPEYVLPSSPSYQSGYTDGREYQRSLMTSATFTENGEYYRANGWSNVIVDVDIDDAFQSGYTSGVTWRDQQDIPGKFTENGSYRRPNGYGWNQVNVQVDTVGPYNSGFTQGYLDGYESGVTHTKDQMTDLMATANNMTYSSETGYKSVFVQIQMSGSLGLSASTNGHFEYDAHDFGVAGWEYVYLDVDVPTDADYQQGYNDGFGVGYSSGLTDGFQSGYTSGYTSGVTWRNQQDIPGKFTENGTYTRQNGYGWNQVTVQVDTDAYFNSGVTSGITYQKSLLASTAITQNGTYTRTDGWDNVTVNVPTTQVVTMTRAEYEAVCPKDPNTIYLIKD